MEKVKIAFSKALAWLNKAYQWLNKEGGMLHILACYSSTLTFAPLGFGWASAITWTLAIGKEGCDIARKKNTLLQTINDIIRDAIGYGAALLTYYVGWSIL